MRQDPGFDISQDEIDLLAEGELDRVDRESLFEKLDKDPLSWRRVALALLETRALAESVNHAVDRGYTEHSATSIPVVAKKPASKPASSQRANVAFWVTACCVLFVVGMAIGPQLFPRENTHQTAATNDGNSQMIENPVLNRLADHESVVWQQINQAVQSLGVSDCKILALVGVNGQTGPKFYPVIESSQLQRQLFEMPAPRLPAAYADRLHRQGWKLDSKRHFVSVNHPDGRRETFPIGRLMYQNDGSNSL
jgi:hypothetical protein